jgi:hypothetical protein
MNTPSLTQNEFRAAFAHGAVQSVALAPVGAKFAVQITTLTGLATLTQARKNEPRLFGSVDVALRLFHSLGVQQITLADLGQWQPQAAKTERRTRPDRSAALTRAAEYEAWFQQRASQGLANLNAGQDPVLSDAEWQASRLALRKSLIAPRTDVQS